MKKNILTIAYFGVAGTLFLLNSCQPETVSPNDPNAGTTPTWNTNDSTGGNPNDTLGGGTGNPTDTLGGGNTGGGTGNPTDTTGGGNNTDSLNWNP